jgi:hypothetical protein
MSGKDIINVRVEQGTRIWWQKEAVKNGFIYGKGGATGEFLDAIAQGKYVVISQAA